MNIESVLICLLPMIFLIGVWVYFNSKMKSQANPLVDMAKTNAEILEQNKEVLSTLKAIKAKLSARAGD
jgi:ATP-dependent Zn protease